VTGALEQPRQGIAVGREPAVADVDRAGGVGRHELDHDLLAAAQLRGGVRRRALVDDLGEDVVQPGGCEAEVHEARTGDLDGLDVRRQVGVEVLDELGGQLARVAPGLLGRGERHVRGPVAVLPVGRSLHRDLLRKRFDGERHQGAAHGFGEIIADHGRGPSRTLGTGSRRLLATPRPLPNR
jgi:hypothetical protein